MKIITVPINGYSDGDVSSHPPAGGKFTIDPNPLYLEKLAKQWMETTGDAQIGTKYILDRLPAGYELFSRPRSSGLRDKFLYGHPSHRHFDSANRFYPHFRHLMEYPNTEPCACDLCTSGKAPKRQPDLSQQGSAKPTKAQASAAKTRGRPPVDKGPQDEEGSPDIYTQVFQLLRTDGTINCNLEEVMSMDWRAERKLVSIMINTVPLQSSFIPRLGEIVLWCRKVEGEIILDPETEEFRVHDATSGQYLGHPQWLGGVITKVPTEEVLVKDLLKETTKQHAVNVSGFRVECLPDPNGSAKGLSKQYSYVPMHHIRPMCFWKEALKGIPEKQWHPSVSHALSITATLSTVERYRAEGTWPNCNIHCKGLFVGAEALFIGDAVRFTCYPGTSVLGVLRISDIVVRFEQLTVTNNGNVSSGTARYIHVYVLGDGYTLDQQSSYNGMEVDLDTAPGSLPPGMRGYAKWYHMCGPGKRLEVTYDCLLGRCFEAEAMRSWWIAPKENLDAGLTGNLAAREYSARIDIRIAGIGKRWYWGNYRADSLDIETFNGFEVGQYNTDRDPKMWRSNLKILDGVAERVPQQGQVMANKASPVQVGFSPANAKSTLVARALQNDGLSEGNGKEIGLDALPEDNADSMEDEIDAVVDSVFSGQLLGGEGDTADISDDLQRNEFDGGEITSPQKKRARLEV